MSKKDSILIIGSGGMSGIFSSGVLKALEDSPLASRIHSVYAVSVGACTAARFLARESELGGRTFYTRFNDDRFLRGHFIRYFFQVLFRTRQPEDILNFRYFTEILHDSDDRIDMRKVIGSEIPFYVKVFNVGKKAHEWLRIQEPNAYEKVLASASMTPLTSARTVIDGEELFDGDTIPSDLETELARNNPDKLVLKINNCKTSFLDVLNLPVLAIIYILISRMYGSKVANLYSKNFFRKFSWDRSLAGLKNVVLIENEIPGGSFASDTVLLKRMYEHGLRKGTEVLRNIEKPE